ncbi:hypothetical protein V6N11_069727 [Hibiscus sabdariffa]|uniref:Uncharacterized protein n=1 Tax=Hibiscus sabdariffa TaxID=183260 RepID=A0ABR2Q3N0_9ROSI
MSVCRRARELAKEEINGNYKYEFKRLFDYANALRRADTDGIIDLLDNVCDEPPTCSSNIPDVPSSRTTA